MSKSKIFQFRRYFLLLKKLLVLEDEGRSVVILDYAHKQQLETEPQQKEVEYTYRPRVTMALSSLGPAADEIHQQLHIKSAIQFGFCAIRKIIKDIQYKYLKHSAYVLQTSLSSLSSLGLSSLSSLKFLSLKKKMRQNVAFLFFTAIQNNLCLEIVQH